jgi:pseudouridylate synthase
MPYPRNLECAIQIENVVRSEGAIPATIAILNGVPHVGLDQKQLYGLAKYQHTVKKASTRDIAYCMAQGHTASTTVASTMAFAHRAGIKVFATGGIGGVHRGVEETMDVSADLFELAQTPVTVVCAGNALLLYECY